MPELDDKPYVLCPDLEQHGIRVTPLWFAPQGGSQEGPVLVLESVPLGFHTVLVACGFIQRPEGWLVDATDKDEAFWRRIFGDIPLTKRKPARLYQPQRLAFYPPPSPVKAEVANFTDDHLKYLTKNEGVIGLEAVRMAQKDAMRGAVTCRGAWSVLKAACLERLGKNPEDAQSFEYAWATAKSAGLDPEGLPAAIPHTALLSKIIERGRVTAAMEKVIPSWFRTTGPVAFTLHVDWHCRTVFSGAARGPLDRKVFSEVDQLAQFLMDEGCEPLADDNLIADFSARVSALVSAQSDVPSPQDWVADIEIPEIEQDPAVTDVTPEGPEPPPPAESVPSEALDWRSTYAAILELHDLVERRVPYSRVLCRHLLWVVTFKGARPLGRPELLRKLRSLLELFASVINEETLFRLWEREGTQILSLSRSIASPADVRLNLLKVLRSADEAKKVIESRLVETQGEQLGWWWTGYSCSREGMNTQKNWVLYRVSGGRCDLVENAVYDDFRSADEALHHAARARRLSCMRQGLLSDTWFHAYRTASGAILRLGSEEYTSQEEAATALNELGESYLMDVAPPVLWDDSGVQWTSERVRELVRTIMELMDCTAGMETLGGALDWKESDDGIVAVFDGIELGIVAPGNVAFFWGAALYRFSQTHLPEELNKTVDAIIATKAKADLDISIEDDLLDELDRCAHEIGTQLGTVAEEDLRGAIVHPDHRALRRCRELLAVAEDSKVSEELYVLLRSILLFTSQTEPHHVLTPLFKEKLRLGCSFESIFQHVFAQFVWLRIYDVGGTMNDALAACGAPGDSPAGDLYPGPGLVWRLQLALQSLVEASDALLSGEEEEAAASGQTARPPLMRTVVAR